MSEFRPLDALRAVRDLRGVSGVKKAVLFALVMRADDKGRCWPSFTTIAADAGISLRAAKTAVASLFEAGHLTVVRRPVEGKREHDSNMYLVKVVQQLHDVVQDVHQVVHHVHEGSAGGARQVVQEVHGGGAGGALDLPIDLPNGTAHGRLAPSLTLEAPSPKPVKVRGKGRKPPKHTELEIEAKGLVLDHFVKRFEAVKGVKPKSLGAADNAAAFKLAGTYGTAEACSIIDRAFGDAFVVEKNATLRFIASKADTFRGTAPAPKSNGHVVQPVGDVRAWRVGK